jgi:hypothetical protein
MIIVVQNTVIYVLSIFCGPQKLILLMTVCVSIGKDDLKNGTVSDCNRLNDVMCLNGVCTRNARCNGKLECLNGEDDYRCIPKDQSQRDERNAHVRCINRTSISVANTSTAKRSTFVP